MGVISAVFLTMSIISADTGESLTGPLVQGNTDFALKLYSDLKKPEGNLFFSSFSISSAMGMTYAGARGKTAEEMAKAINFDIDQKIVPAAFKQLNETLAAQAEKDNQKLNIANGLCLTGEGVSREFKSLLKDYYDAELFSGGLEKINGWVNQKTEGKIEKILDSLDPNSVCVILNAIYFKGAWDKPFKKTDTRDMSFNISKERAVKVPFMSQKRGLQILKKQDFQAASVPYKGKQLSLVILLPDAIDGIGTLEKTVDCGKPETMAGRTGWFSSGRDSILFAEVQAGNFLRPCSLLQSAWDEGRL